MGTTNITDHHQVAKAISARLKSLTLPATLKPAAKAFGQALNAYESAGDVAIAAKEARDAALHDVSDADAALDASVDLIVDLIPAAGLGRHTAPLTAFSKLSPTRLKNLPVAREPDAVDAVVKRILAEKKKTPDLVAACKKATAEGKVVRAKLEIYGTKQASYAQALAERDALLQQVIRATGSLKRRAAVTWEDKKSTFKSVFGKPTKMEAPKKKRAPTKKGAKAPTATDATPTTPAKK